MKSFKTLFTTIMLILFLGFNNDILSQCLWEFHWYNPGTVVKRKDGTEWKCKCNDPNIKPGENCLSAMWTQVSDPKKEVPRSGNKSDPLRDPADWHADHYSSISFDLHPGERMHVWIYYSSNKPEAVTLFSNEASLANRIYFSNNVGEDNGNHFYYDPQDIKEGNVRKVILTSSHKEVNDGRHPWITNHLKMDDYWYQVMPGGFDFFRPVQVLTLDSYRSTSMYFVLAKIENYNTRLRGLRDDRLSFIKPSTSTNLKRIFPNA